MSGGLPPCRQLRPSSRREHVREHVWYELCYYNEEHVKISGGSGGGREEGGLPHRRVFSFACQFENS